MTPVEHALAVVAPLLTKPEPLVASDNEPELVRFLSIVKSAGVQYRADFVNLFTRMIRGQVPSPQWLVSFCMMELQWPEVRAAAEDEARTGKPGNLSGATEVIDAYTGAWWGYDLFAKYPTPGGE